MNKKYIHLKLMSFFSGLVFFAPVALLLRTSKGITISEFFMLQAILSLGIFIFEVPTGIIADRLGYKYTLICSQILLFFTRIIFLFANSFWIFAIEAIIEALAACFASGTGSAYLYTLSEKDNFMEQSSKIDNLGTAGFIISTLTYPLLYTWGGLNGLIMATAISSSLSLICTFYLPQLEQPHNTDDQAKKFKFSYLCSSKSVCILFNNTSITLAFLIINFFYVTKIESLGGAIELVSVIILGYSLIELSAPRVIKVVNKIPENKRILYLSLLNALILFCIFIIDHWLVILPMLLAPLSLAVYATVIGQVENEFVDSYQLESERATVLSLFNMGSGFLEVVFLGVSAIISSTSTIPFAVVAVILFGVGVFSNKYLTCTPIEEPIEETVS